jgi:hypothetical protein
VAIFTYCYDGENYRWATATVPLVCRRWHEVYSDATSFWTRCSFDLAASPEKLDIWTESIFRKSGRLGLCISLSYGPARQPSTSQPSFVYNIQLNPLMEATGPLFAAASRFKALTIDASIAMVPRLASYILQDFRFDHLETLTLYGTPQMTGVFSLQLSSFPILQNLAVHTPLSLQTQEASEVLKRISHLTIISDDWLSLIDLVDCCNAITFLDIDVIPGSTGFDDIIFQRDLACLSRAERFRLRSYVGECGVYEVLDWVVCRALIVLDITVFPTTFEDPYFAYNTSEKILSFIRKSHCPLKSLRLKGFRNVAADYLQEFPELETLEIG